MKPAESNKPTALSGMSGAIRNFREQPPAQKIPKSRGRPRKRPENDPVHDPTMADEEPSREKEWQTEVNYNIKK